MPVGVGFVVLAKPKCFKQLFTMLSKHSYDNLVSKKRILGILVWSFAYKPEKNASLEMQLSLKISAD